jgi:hypothetical protein
MIPFFQDRASRKCLVDIFSDRARWRGGIDNNDYDKPRLPTSVIPDFPFLFFCLETNEFQRIHDFLKQ